jgi:hypothetical protein
MKDTIKNWFLAKWSDQPALAHDYQITFGSASGQRVMAHMMDNVYCTIYEGTDPIAAAMHAGRRSVVHEMLEILDAVENPRKARFNPPTENSNGLRRDYAS